MKFKKRWTVLQTKQQQKADEVVNKLLDINEPALSEEVKSSFLAALVG